MTFCDVILNLLIGLSSGIVSSWLVTIIYNKRIKKIQAKEKFKRDIQTFHRYILMVKKAVAIAYSTKDKTFLEIMVEDEPILYNFENLKDNNKEKKKEIIDYIKNIIDKFNKTDNIDETNYKAILGILYKYSVEVLKFKENKEENRLWNGINKLLNCHSDVEDF